MYSGGSGAELGLGRNSAIWCGFWGWGGHPRRAGGAAIAGTVAHFSISTQPCFAKCRESDARRDQQ